MNNRYTIKISQPLLTPGMTIEMETSSQEVIAAMKQLLEDTMQINGLEKQLQNEAALEKMTGK
jgi:hypothetical protein